MTMHNKPKSNFSKPYKNSLPKDSFKGKPNKQDIKNENTAHNPSRKEPSHFMGDTKKPSKE